MKNITSFSLSLLIALSLLATQVGGVFAASIREDHVPVSGVIQSITLENDTITGVTIVSVDVVDNDQVVQPVRVNLETAIALGLVVLNGDGKPNINNAALGKPVEIDSATVIPAEEESQHPVGSALATFFSDIEGIDYETIMAAHEQGVGFGVIAQTLWLTTKLEGDAEVFEMLIHAKQTGDFSAFTLEDGTTPENWGQLKKAILSKDKKNNLGVIKSDSNSNGNGNGNNQGNNGNGNGNGNNGNGGNKDKDKDKDKDNENGNGNGKKK
ncbi:MAG TPA: hypothetical protein VFY83_16165 [Anaerolineales bacterium]|nr:hypothetical protein [Anaerolineales bacterium]